MNMMPPRARRLIRSQLRRRHRDLVPFPWPGSLGAHLASLFDTYRINVVLDVGANSGDYGALVREIGFDGLIVSFEPGESAYRRLTARCAGDLDWIAFKEALGSTPGCQELTVFQEDVLSSFRPAVERREWILEGFDLMPFLSEHHRETVPVRRLDAVLPELKERLPSAPRVFLKMDTQGYDLEVFEGAVGARESIVALQSEVSYQPLYRGMPTASDAVTAYRAAGYIESAYFPIHVDDRLRAVEMDLVMVRDDE